MPSIGKVVARWFAAWRAWSAADPRRPLVQALLALAIPAFLLLASGIIAGRPPAGDEIERGVSITGQPVAGAGWQQTAAELRARFDAWLDTPLPIEVDGRRMSVSPRELGMSFDLDATRHAALAIGRGSFLAASAERLDAHTRGVEVAPVVTFDTRTLVAALEALGEATIVPPVDATFVLDGNEIVVEPSESGTGIDAEAAARRLRAAAVDLDRRPVTIPVVTIPPAVSTTDLEQVGEQAAALLREPFLLTDGAAWWQLTPGALAELLTIRDERLTLDTLALDPLIGALAPSVNREAKPAEIVHNGDATFRVEPEVPERRLDVRASVVAIERAVLSGGHQVELVTRERMPTVTTASVQPLLAKANEIGARGMTVFWSDGEQGLDPAAFAAQLQIDEASGEITFNTTELFHLLEPIAHGINRPATGYRWRDWEIVAPEGALPGRLVDINASVNRIVAGALGGNPRSELVVNVEEDLTQIAGTIVINDLLGTSSTYYGNSNNNRRINVELAAAQLDGALIQPGGTFSFNAAIGGTATLDDGYQMGFGIIAGEDGTPKTVPSVAGGICQVATTTFQAAFWSGLPIGARNWHLYWIPNYGSGPGGLQGLDATVDPDYGLDLTFVNPTDQWMAINAVADGEWITVEVWGTPQGWDVLVDDPAITNVVKADPTPVRQFSPDIPPGTSAVVEHAQDGFTATIHRVVSKDGQVVDDLTLTSYYLPSRNVTLVGEGVPLEEPEPVVEEPVIEEPVDEPTEEPVEEPTEEPVATPEPEPTEEPVEVPTEVPTEAPVVEETPIAEPTVEPTEATVDPVPTEPDPAATAEPVVTEEPTEPITTP
jgi:vancomycin resistance protein YoaR